MADITFSGWKLFDDIIIVCKGGEISDYRQGYIVDANNKKELESARHWATQYYNKNEPIEYSYKNDGFSFQLFESADGSSQGGKLSFWNCLVSKDNGEVIKVGINADLLLDLLMNTEFINGKSQTNVLFARNTGRVGVLHKDMIQYKNALNDMSKRDIVKSKTSKHIIGRNYYTLTENNNYLGDVYDWFEEVKANYSNYRNGEYIVGYRITEKPKVLKMFHTVRKEDNEITKISEFLDSVKEQSRKGDDMKYYSLYYYGLDETLKKLPSRTEGDISADDLNSYIEYIRNYKMVEKIKYMDKHARPNYRDTVSPYDISRFGYSAYADKLPVFTEKELEFMGKLLMK